MKKMTNMPVGGGGTTNKNVKINLKMKRNLIIEILYMHRESKHALPWHCMVGQATSTQKY
jgi:hypothetical protein